MWCIQMLAAFLHICNDSNNSKLERLFYLVDEKSVLFCLWLREVEVLDSINVQLQNWPQLLVDTAAEHRPTTDSPKLFFPESFFCFSGCGRARELQGPFSSPGAAPALIDYPNPALRVPQSLARPC